MVHQKPVNFVTKSKVRKNLKNDKKQNIKDLAGPREALAMEALHTMFIKSLAQKSNFVAFQNRKNIVDQKTMLAGAKQALEECSSRVSLETEDESSGGEEDS